MSGRQPPPYRNKKLVRSRRLSHADSSDESVAGGEDPATPPSHHAAVAGDAGPAHSSGPASRWKRASVKAVELQENGDGCGSVCVYIYIYVYTYIWIFLTVNVRMCSADSTQYIDACLSVNPSLLLPYGMLLLSMLKIVIVPLDLSKHDTAHGQGEVQSE